MAGEITSVGTLLINESLPEDMRKAQHRLDKKGVHALFMELAARHPEKYKEVLSRLSQVGATAAWTEGLSVSLVDIHRSQAKEKVLAPVRAQLRQIIDDDDLTDEERRDAITSLLVEVAKPLQDAVFEESKARGSGFAIQVESGARGNKGSLASLKGADLLVTDQNDRFLPFPILHSYAEGFTPAEYFAASYGQRKGQLDTKLAVGEAGFTNKKLVNAAHRQVVTHEKPPPRRLPVGLPVDTDDTANIGAVLAIDMGGIPAGTVLTDEHLQDLRDQDIDEILIASPMTEASEDGGISAWAAGRRIRNGLHQVGDNIGIPAAQAIGERLSQGSLNSKHSAGVQTRISKYGAEYLNRLIEAPDHFPEAGPLAEEDGVVEEIKPAPQGGHYIRVGKREYYAGEGVTPTVKVGDQLEQGDDLTDGTPHPKDLVRLRGMGEARRVYMRELRSALEGSGVKAHRRNVESVVAGLLNWARITDPDGIGDNIYDDVVPYGYLTAQYQPRRDAAKVEPHKAIGQYLEEPVLHYTPGTRVTRKVADRLKKWKIADITTHPEPPGFEPNMVRGLLSVYHDPDWKTRLSGFYTARAFERSLHRGLESDAESTSYVPAVAKPTTLGKNLTSQGKYG